MLLDELERVWWERRLILCCVSLMVAGCTPWFYDCRAENLESVVLADPEDQSLKADLPPCEPEFLQAVLRRWESEFASDGFSVFRASLGPLIL
jgi:hypothetical protein